MSVPESELIPAREVDRFEWLALESLWALAKSPMPTQWERWKQHPDPTDPASVLGLVIDGNLNRVNIDFDNAERAEEIGLAEPDVDILLSRAITGLGKVSGGLINAAAHFRTNYRNWDAPINEHLPTFFEVVDETLDLSVSQYATSTESEYYYAQLARVSNAIASLDKPDKRILPMQSQKLAKVASVATSTWIDYMRGNPHLLLEPGGTPRSTGQLIEDLRQDFEQYVPTINGAAEIRR